MSYFIDPDSFIIDTIQDQDKATGGGITHVNVDAALMYGAFLTKLTETGDVATVTRPADSREQRYLREVQAFGNSAVENAAAGTQVHGPAVAAKNGVLETIRKWATYITYDYVGDDMIRLHLKNLDGAADMYRLQAG